MKIYEEKIVAAAPEHTVKVCTKRKCDLCGFETKGDEWEATWSWVSSNKNTSVCVEVKSQQPTAKALR